MWFVVCWITLGGLLVVHALVRRNWITGQSAFTGVWFLSLTGLWGFPPAQAFISAEAALLIIFVHFSFFFGSTTVAYNLFRGRKAAPLEFAPNTRTKKVLVYISRMLIFIGMIGSWLAVDSSGSFNAFQNGTLALMRSMVFEQVIGIPISARLMSNFLYPASILGTICFLSSRRSFWSWLYILLPVIGSMLYGFAFGGRGAVIIVVPMIFWVLAIGGKNLFSARTDRLLLICVITVVLLFTGIIDGTRRDSSQVIESVSWYFTGPIPAFSEWLNIKPVVLINADFSNVAIVREIMRLFGSYSERSIGIDIVFVPYGFNVFTHLAEQIRDFGIIGALVVSTLLGAFSSALERKPLSVSVLGVRAAIYAYLSFSLFADLSFFIVGWWLAIFIIVFIVPLFEQFVSIPATEREVYRPKRG